MILAIDPGPMDSAYVILDENLKPIKFEKCRNEKLKGIIACTEDMDITIEMIASYGMAVGAEVFETCVWIGRFIETAERNGIHPLRIKRKEVSVHLCESTKANDSNVKQALIDRFAYGVPNKGKGIVNKKVNQPGWFYGFADDVWQAYALGVTYADLYKR